MITAATRSLDTAASGSTLNSSTSIGVISAPPPMPVRPTTKPTTTPASATSGSRCTRDCYRPTVANENRVGIDDVVDAAQRLRGVIRPTPVAAADAIAKAVGRRVLLKPEQLQRTGSFKIRGAYNRISRLDADVAVVAASAGNHAQGVALAAALTNHRATIFMPATAPLPKVEATKAYGATIRLVDGLVDEAITAAPADAAATGAVYVPPFDDPLIIAGQGTIGLELLAEAGDAEVVVVPIGGGGLISGIALA